MVARWGNGTGYGAWGIDGVMEPDKERSLGGAVFRWSGALAGHPGRRGPSLCFHVFMLWRFGGVWGDGWV